MGDAEVLQTVDALLAQLTLEEKVVLLGGSDSWHAAGVPRLGIPDLKITDGSNGARGATMSNGPRSACFPCGTAMGATWDVELVRRVGVATAEEAKLKGARVLLAPTVNMHRTPLAGRNFECYSEDPFLASRLTVAHIEGVQSEGVAACVKHFVANDQEFERLTISAEVDERTLREIYLPPFEAAVTEARAWSVMSSYNRLNGTYASEHPWLLTTVLRDEWDFDGFVVSDWGGTHATAAALNAGLDCEMPGPPEWYGAKLVEAVEAGEVTQEAVDAAARRMLLVRARTGVLDPGWVEPEEAEDDRPHHRALIREAAASAIVLLRNDGVLPLDPGTLRRVAVIGPNAAVARVQGGGSPEVRSHPAQSPLSSLVERLGEQVEVVYEVGADVQRGIPRLRIPLTAEYFAGETFDGEPTGSDSSDGGGSWWYNADVPGFVPGGTFSARLTGSYVVQQAGPHEFSLQSRGLSRLYVDGRLCIDNWTSQDEDGSRVWGSAARTGKIDLRAGQRIDVRIDFTSRHPKSGGVVIGMRTPVPDDAIERAAAAARSCDVAIVVAGTSADYESETFDRETMQLPGSQDELIRAVATANPNTVVLVNAGAPVTMPWHDQAAAVAQCWFLGEETGPAMAAFLCGDVDASGRLPTTLPRRHQDTPAFTSYPGENGVVRYGEGLFVGYRWYDQREIEPLHPFGHGLSYATYEYGPVTAERSGDDVVVSVPVTNTSARDGREVVQVYVHDLESRLARPPQELKGFAKVDVPAGTTVPVTVRLSRDAFRYFDGGNGGWVVEPGEFQIRVGRSSRDIRGTVSITYP